MLKDKELSSCQSYGCSFGKFFMFKDVKKAVDDFNYFMSFQHKKIGLSEEENEKIWEIMKKYNIKAIPQTELHSPVHICKKIFGDFKK